MIPYKECSEDGGLLDSVQAFLAEKAGLNLVASRFAISPGFPETMREKSFTRIAGGCVAMMDEADLNIPPHSLAKVEKEKFLDERLLSLTRLHYANCAEYRRILDAMGFDPSSEWSYEELPFIPVRLFKQCELKSVLAESVGKTLTSSGTTGQQVSKIFLGREPLRPRRGPLENRLFFLESPASPC